MGTAGSAAAHVVGPVPARARLAGALGVIAGVVLVAGWLLPYVRVGAFEVTPLHGPLDFAAMLTWAAVVAAAGVSALLGRLPRFGLAVVSVSGALAIGSGVGELYQFQDVDSHRAVEIFFGQRLVTTSLTPLAGVWVQLAAYAVLVLALLLTLSCWSQTTMEDAGEFDALRPRVMGLSAIAGLVGVLAVASPPQDAPKRVVQDATGFQVTVDVPGGVSLLERFGADLLGGALLALAVFVVALLVATLRPRLATVGGLIGLSAYFLSTAAQWLLESRRYADVVAAVGTWLALLAGLLFAVLAGYCLRAGRRAGTESAEMSAGGSPRPAGRSGRPAGAARRTDGGSRRPGGRPKAVDRRTR